MKKGDMVCSKDHSIVGVIIDNCTALNSVTLAVLWNEPPTAQGCNTFIIHKDNIEPLPRGTIIRQALDNGKCLECKYDRYDSKRNVIYDKEGKNNLCVACKAQYDIIFVNDVSTKTDAVNHPSHYTQGKIEVIEYIEDKKLGYHLGNVIKYVSRAGHKNNALEDLKKARWYLNREIENMEVK